MIGDLLFRLRTLSRRTVAIVAGVVVLLAAGATAAVLLLGDREPEVPDGYTLAPTVEQPDTDQARPAQARPDQAPPKIFAEGECKVLLDDVRAVIDAYPSGLVLGEEGSAALNAALAPLNAADSACSIELVGDFNTQELSPWMNYLVPAAPAADQTGETDPAAPAEGTAPVTDGAVD